MKDNAPLWAAFSVASSFALASQCCLFRLGFSHTYFTFTLLIYCLFMLLIFRENVMLAFVVSCLAYIFSYSVFCCVSGVVLLLGAALAPEAVMQPRAGLLLVIGVLSCLAAQIPFCIRHFKSGMKFLQHYKFQHAAFLFSLFALSLLSFAESHYYASSRGSLLAPLCFIFLIFSLLVWWDKNLSDYYLQRLRSLELESLRAELAEKDALIERLHQNNEAQARLIHRDNKLIPAMLSAVTGYLKTAVPRKDDGQALSEELTALATDRMDLLRATSYTPRTPPLTGCAGLDAMLGYMGARAKQDGISFDVKLHPEFAAEFGQVLSELELTHLLSNLIENALTATRGAKKRALQVHLGRLRTTLIVEVSDSGQEFDAAVYQSLGLSKHSSHPDSGGNGIGLMELWALKRKTGASLLITEYVPQTALYTKTISLIFDWKNHYLIQTYRPQTLIAMQTRSDLYVLPLD